MKKIIKDMNYLELDEFLNQDIKLSERQLMQIRKHKNVDDVHFWGTYEKDGIVIEEYDVEIIKDGTFVTIESDILKFLINSTNSNVIKIYCFLKWFLIDQKHYEKTKEVRYIEKPIDRKFILKQIGLNSNSGKMASSISRDIEDMLVMTHLIERRRIVKQEFGKTKYVYYYSIVPYEEWKSFRESVRKNGIKK